MSEKLEVIITAVDQATGVLKGIAGVAQGILTVGLAVAGAAAGALAAGLGLSIKEAMEAQEVQAQLAAVLKSTGSASTEQAKLWEENSKKMVSGTRLTTEELAKLNAKLKEARAAGDQKAARDLIEQIKKGSEVVTRSMADILGIAKPVKAATEGMVLALADTLSGMTRFSDEAIISGESLLLTFTNIGSNVFPDVTKAMLDMSQAMGQDIKSSAIQLGKALNDPVAGLSALQRVGVTFTEAQEKLIKKMVEAGDVAGAQKMILAELQKEFGGSAVAAGKTFAGQLDILRNSLLNVAEGVGMQLLPTMQKFVSDVIMPAVPQIEAFVSALVDKLLAYIPIIVEDIKEITKEIQTFVQTAIIPFIKEHGETLKTVLTGIVAGFAAFVVITTVVSWVTGLIAAFSAAGAAISAAGGIIGAIVALLGGPVTIVIGAVAIAVGVLAAAWKGNWGGIRDTLTSLWENSIKPAIMDLWNWLQVEVPKAIETLRGYWENTLLPAIQRVWTWLKTYLFPFLEALADLISAVVGKAVEYLSKLWEETLLPAIKKVDEWFQKNIKPTLEEIAKVINSVIGPAIAWLKDSLIDPMNGKLEALQNWLEKVTNWFKKLAEAIRGVPDYSGPNPRTALLPDGSVVSANGVEVGTGQAQGLPVQAAGTVNNWNLIINEAGRSVDPVGAFELMRALAG